jgi:hypothetical protein
LSSGVEASLGTSDNDVDSDGDGATDGEEYQGSSNPMDAADKPNNLEDADGDGLSSGVEASLGTSDNDVDSDGDGAGDKEEYENESNPMDANDKPSNLEDKDGDGLSAAVEESLGTSDNDVDSDRDGATDDEEYQGTTNPLDSSDKPTDITDADGDGLSAAMESSLGTSDKNIDSDFDGASDQEEYGSLTDPLNASDKPAGISDQDQDGLSASVEAMLGTSDNEVDSDRDGAGDKEEYENETNPMDPDDKPSNLTDEDGDGLSEAVEAAMGTSDSNIDSDFDGATDLEELQSSTDPTDLVDRPTDIMDEDGDGLSAALETSLGTSDNNIDTDGDGAGDKEEHLGQTDPLDANDMPSELTDQDQDGLSSSIEASIGTSDALADSDGDFVSGAFSS